MKQLTLISSWWLLSMQINAVGQLPAVTAHGKYLIRFPIGNFMGTMHRKFQIIASLWRFCTWLLYITCTSWYMHCGVYYDHKPQTIRYPIARLLEGNIFSRLLTFCKNRIDEFVSNDSPKFSHSLSEHASTTLNSIFSKSSSNGHP